MKRLAPETFRAAEVRWQLFVTLTWRGQPPRAETREKRLRHWLRMVARWARVPFPDLVWIARDGDPGRENRPHFHVLIAGFPDGKITFDLGCAMCRMWNYGHVEGRRWVKGLGALDYSATTGGNAYESKRYSASQPITCSENLRCGFVGRPVGDSRQEQEDAGHSDNPSEASSACCGVGLDHWQPVLTSLVAEGRGYLANVNASSRHVEYNFQAAITGAL